MKLKLIILSFALLKITNVIGNEIENFDKVILNYNATEKQIFYPYETCLFPKEFLQVGNDCKHLFDDETFSDTLPKLILPCVAGMTHANAYLVNGGENNDLKCRLRNPIDRIGLYTGWKQTDQLLEEGKEDLLSYHEAFKVFNLLSVKNITSLALLGDSVLEQFNQFLICDLYRSGKTSLHNVRAHTSSSGMKRFKMDGNNETFTLFGKRVQGVCGLDDHRCSEDDRLTSIFTSLEKNIVETLSVVKEKTVIVINIGLHLHKKTFWSVPYIVKGLVLVEEKYRSNATFLFLETSAQAFANKIGGEYEGIETIPNDFCCAHQGEINNTVNEIFQENFRRFDLAGRIGWIPLHEISTEYVDLYAEKGGIDCTHFIYSPVAYAPVWRSMANAMENHFSHVAGLK